MLTCERLVASGHASSSTLLQPNGGVSMLTCEGLVASGDAPSSILLQPYRAAGPGRVDRSAKIGYNPRRSHAICPMLVGPNTVERRVLDDPGRHIEPRP